MCLACLTVMTCSGHNALEPQFLHPVSLLGGKFLLPHVVVER